MRANEALRSSAKAAVQVLMQSGTDLQKKSTVTAVAKEAWKRHRKVTKQGWGKVTATSWSSVHPSWKGRYRKMAQEVIAAQLQSTANANP